MARTSAEDPIKVFRFTVDIGSINIGFMECSGLKASTEVSEYREGGDNETVKKSPGLTKFDDITLKRGQILNGSQNAFQIWYQRVHDVTGGVGGAPDFRRDIEITQYNRNGDAAVRWRIHEAWPKEFKPFSDLNATSNDNSIEELVITHEGFEKVPV
jgi:phage tail-like protein